MAEGHLQKTKPGEPFRPRASDWNAFVDAADFARNAGAMGFGPVGEALPTGVIWLRNDSGVDVDTFGALNVDDVIVSAADNVSEFRSRIAFGGSLSGSLPLAVLLEPIPNGSYGRAMTHGITQAKVNIVSELHGYASLPTGDALLESAPLGEVRILWKESGTGEKWAVVLLTADHGQAIRVYPKNEGETLVDGHVYSIAKRSDSAQWTFDLGLPSEDDQPNVIAYAGPTVGDDGGYMRVTPIVRALVDLFGDPSVLVGYEYGPLTGSPKLWRGHTGFVAVGQETIGGDVYGYFYRSHGTVSA